MLEQYFTRALELAEQRANEERRTMFLYWRGPEWIIESFVPGALLDFAPVPVLIVSPGGAVRIGIGSRNHGAIRWKYTGDPFGGVEETNRILKGDGVHKGSLEAILLALRAARSISWSTNTPIYVHPGYHFGSWEISKGGTSENYLLVEPSGAVTMHRPSERNVPLHVGEPDTELLVGRLMDALPAVAELARIYERPQFVFTTRNPQTGNRRQWASGYTLPSLPEQVDLYLVVTAKHDVLFHDSKEEAFELDEQ
jgi:hypothetical protein